MQQQWRGRRRTSVRVRRVLTYRGKGIVKVREAIGSSRRSSGSGEKGAEGLWEVRGNLRYTGKELLKVREALGSSRRSSGRAKRGSGGLWEVRGDLRGGREGLGKVGAARGDRIWRGRGGSCGTKRDKVGVSLSPEKGFKGRRCTRGERGASSAIGGGREALPQQ